jgi:O-antigen/teichoic acid export membrane protein
VIGLARKTVRNTALLVAFEIANPLLSLLLIGTMSRRLGAEGLGAYNLLLTFFFVAHSFTALGLNTLITREVARDRGAALRYLTSSSVLGVTAAVLGALGLEVVVRLAGYDAQVIRAAWMIGVALLPSIVILYVEAIFIAHEKVHFIVYTALVENALKVVIGLWLLRAGFGVGSLIASFTALRFLALVVELAIFQRQIAPLAWRFDSGVLRFLARNIPVFGGILVVATLYARADVFLLSTLSGLTAVGFYTAAYRLFALSQVVPKSFNTSIYPVLSHLFVHSPDGYRRAKSLSIRYTVVLLLPVAAGIHGLAEPVMRLLFGTEFVQAAPILRVVIWTLVPYGVTKVLASSLFASDRQVVDLNVNLLGLGANLALNLLLIPRYGAVGCAWATLISMMFFLACQLFFLRREMVPILRQAAIVRPVMAAAALAAFLALTPDWLLPFRVAGGALVYMTLVFALQVVTVGELRRLMPERLAALLPGESKP